MRITDKERQALQGIMDSDFQDGEHPVNNWVWSFSANPWADTKQSRTFAGTLSSLIKKGLAKQEEEGRDACVAITQAGYDAMQKK